jgi:hypothetical protein
MLKSHPVFRFDSHREFSLKLLLKVSNLCPRLIVNSLKELSTRKSAKNGIIDTTDGFNRQKTTFLSTGLGTLLSDSFDNRDCINLGLKLFGCRRGTDYLLWLFHNMGFFLLGQSFIILRSFFHLGC